MKSLALPNSMRFINVTTPGDAGMLEVLDTALPVVKEDELLIKVAAAGVNRPDIIQRQGHYPPPPGASPILGLEVAGTVVAIGAQVDNWQLEQTVCALTNGGGYAEYVAVPASQCLKVPSTLSLDEAAAIPETYFTVWFNLFSPGLIRQDTLFLVHGGSSGIGSTAIQLAKAWGATAITTVGNQAKSDFCRSLGADHVINYQEQDFVAAITDLYQGKGVDIILDMVGGNYVSKNIKIAARNGHIISIAFLQGAKVEVNLAPMMIKRLTLTGSTLRPQPSHCKAQIAQALEDKIWPLFEQQKLIVPIDSRYRFDDVASAHHRMESGQHMGKIILLP